MKGRRKLTVSKFEKRHPDVSLHISESGPSVCVAATEVSRGKEVIADRHGPASSRHRLLWELSEAVQAIRRLEVARAQGYRDAQTGEIKPLQTHHVVFRSHGGTHERRNLSGLSAESHRRRHERNHL